MNIKHLQLNTSILSAPHKIAQFILDKSVDVACLQEIVYPIDGGNTVIADLEEKGYYAAEGVHYYFTSRNQRMGVTIISKFPIVDYYQVYYNADKFGPKNISENDLIGEILNDTPTDTFPGSRGQKYSIMSRCILICTLSTDKGFVRVMTTHFTVSDLCTEIPAMYEMSLMINSLVKNSKDIPTIFSGDLNIRPQSYSVNKIREVLTCHTLDFTDTLFSNHPAKKKDFPEGLAVDHVFSKNFTHNSTEAVQVEFSDHKALISLFSI